MTRGVPLALLWQWGMSNATTADRERKERQIRKEGASI